MLKNFNKRILKNLSFLVKCLKVNKSDCKLTIKITLSKILENKKESIDFFVKLIQTRGSKVTLLYRGSEHGFGAADFHSKCNNQGKTISLISDTNKNVFGGYTS